LSKASFSNLQNTIDSVLQGKNLPQGSSLKTAILNEDFHVELKALDVDITNIINDDVPLLEAEIRYPGR
jgi:CRISPR-associated protein Cmr4